MSEYGVDGVKEAELLGEDAFVNVYTPPLIPKGRKSARESLKHIPCDHVTSRVKHHIVWHQNKRCPHRHKCWYSHTYEEYKAALIPKPCYSMKPDGSCSVRNCKFDHELTKTLLQSKPSSTQICRFVREDGTCKFGSLCKFSHTPQVTMSPLSLPSAAIHAKRKPTPFLIDITEESDGEEQAEEHFNVVNSVLDDAMKLLAISLHENESESMRDYMQNVDELEKQICALEEGAKECHIHLQHISEEQRVTILHLLQNAYISSEIAISSQP